MVFTESGEIYTKCIEKIAEKYLMQLCKRAEQVGVRLELPADLASDMASRCKKTEGARQLRGMIQEELESPLADWLLRNTKKPARLQMSDLNRISEQLC